MRDRTMTNARLVYTAGHPEGMRRFQIHFPVDEPVDVRLQKFKVEWLLAHGCEVVKAEPAAKPAPALTSIEGGATPAPLPVRKPARRRRFS